MGALLRASAFLRVCDLWDRRRKGAAGNRRASQCGKESKPDGPFRVREGLFCGLLTRPQSAPPAPRGQAASAGRRPGSFPPGGRRSVPYLLPCSETTETCAEEER